MTAAIIANVLSEMIETVSGAIHVQKKPGALSPSHRAFSIWPLIFSPTTKTDLFSIIGDWKNHILLKLDLEYIILAYPDIAAFYQ